MDWRNKLIRVDKLGKAKRNNVKNQNSEHKQNGARLIFPTYQKHLDFFFSFVFTPNQICSGSPNHQCC
jgi:hypothetical protein